MLCHSLHPWEPKYGNAGLVLVNQIIDYIHRGDELSDMCLYEYCEKVYKSVIKEDDIKKNESAKKLRAHKESNLGRYNFYKKKKGPLPQPKYNYSDEHPQSDTHWQMLRTDNQKLVPALSKLPPSKNSSKMKYQKCMLLLFKPFKTFTDLFNGISWDESYDTANFISPYTEYIENIQEMHVGLEEKKQKGDEDDVIDNDDELIEELDDVDG